MTARRPQYALLLLVILLAPVRARGADRFYTDLLTRGSQAYASAEYDEAARLLRIACFGFLEEPPLLLEGLLQLSLAHAANGDIDDFRSVFNRITDLERRFGVYSATELPESVRTAFETEAAARIPSRDLQALSLSTLSRGQSYEDLSGLPIKKRRAELRRRATTDPDDIRWPLALAELETAAGRPRNALNWIDWLTELDPLNRTAGCLRGLNLAETGDCETALVFLERCQATAADLRFSTPQLRCLVKAGSWEAAAELAATHPTDFRSNAPYSEWLDRVESRVV